MRNSLNSWNHIKYWHLVIDKLKNGFIQCFIDSKGKYKGDVIEIALNALFE